jgi:hypothetical protein
VTIVGSGVTLVLDGVPPLGGASPASQALGRLRETLVNRGVDVTDAASIGSAAHDRVCVVISSPATSMVRATLFAAGVELPDEPGVLALLPTEFDRRSVLLVTGTDLRGMVSAVMKLADLVEHADDPQAALHLTAPLVERPA